MTLHDHADGAFMAYLEARLLAMRTGSRLTRRGTHYSPRSADGYATMLKYLRQHAQHSGPLVAAQLDEQWFGGFLAYLLTTDLRHNSIHSALRKARALAREQCRLTQQWCPEVTLPIAPELTTKVYHSPAELARLTAADLSAWPRLAVRRDAYLIQCHTGLRYGDLRRVLADATAYTEHAAGHTFWRVRQQKTGSEVVVPLRAAVLDLLARHQGQLLLPSLQFYNQAIKQVALQAGLTQPVTVTYTQHGLLQRRQALKCTLVSSHTARRSFATNAYLAGVPTRQLMQLTGHRTEAAFLVYIRADSLATALALASHPFFSDA